MNHGEKRVKKSTKNTLKLDKKKHKCSYTNDEDDKLIQYLHRKLKIRSTSDENKLLRSVAAKELFGNDELVESLTSMNDVEHGLAGKSEIGAGEKERVCDSNTSLVQSVSAVDVSTESRSVTFGKVVNSFEKTYERESTARFYDSHLKRVLLAAFNRVSNENLIVITNSLTSTLITRFEAFCLQKTRECASPLLQSEIQTLKLEICSIIANGIVESADFEASTALCAPSVALTCSIAFQFEACLLQEYLKYVLLKFTALLEGEKESSHKSSCFVVKWSVTVISLIYWFGLMDVVVVKALLDRLLIWYNTKSSEDALLKISLITIILRITGSELIVRDPIVYATIAAEIKQKIQTVRLRIQEMETNINMYSARVDLILDELKRIESKISNPEMDKLLFTRSCLRRIQNTDKEYKIQPNILPSVLLCTESGHYNANIGSYGEQVIESSWLRIAKKHHINSPLHQQVFKILFESNNPDIAAVKLLSIMRSFKSMGPLFDIILHCLTLERLYNPFYVTVISRLCNNPDKRCRLKMIKGLRQSLHHVVNNLKSATSDRSQLVSRFLTELEPDVHADWLTRLLEKIRNSGTSHKI